MRELGKHASNVARAFQAARAQGLIEAEPGDAGSGDPLYRLTPSGLHAFGRRPVAMADERAVSSGQPERKLPLGQSERGDTMEPGRRFGFISQGEEPLRAKAARNPRATSSRGVRR
jgi:hypothetical protein